MKISFLELKFKEFNHADLEITILELSNIPLGKGFYHSRSSLFSIKRYQDETVNRSIKNYKYKFDILFFNYLMSLK